MLQRHEPLFDGTLGTFRTEPVSINLKPDSIPHYNRVFPIPKIHEDVLKTEVDRLCAIGVLRKSTGSPWGSPCFIIPKNNGTVRFITDFRKLNKCTIRKPFPLPKITDMLHKLEGFQYACSIDLAIGYYIICIYPGAREACTIVLPWVKYEYLRLLMGIHNGPDIFQEKMSDLMRDLEFTRT